MPVTVEEAGAGRPSAADLRAIGLFGGLGEELLAELAERLPLGQVASGEVVFREDDQGREMFVVLSGELEVVKRAGGGRVTLLQMIGPREWFGEMSLLDVMPRPVTVRAIAPSRVLRIRPTDLEALYRRSAKDYALFVMNIARQLSRRLRHTEKALADAMTSVLEPPNEPTA
jgi:CRP/FNR family transcriptional regulator, cyclic AMP receptor protein